MSTDNNILKNKPLQDVLEKANAYKRGAAIGAGAGLMLSLFVVKGRYVLCTLGGALIGGYFNYKFAEVKQNPPQFTNYGTAPEAPVQPASPAPIQPDSSNNLQTELINSADGPNK